MGKKKEGSSKKKVHFIFGYIYTKHRIVPAGKRFMLTVPCLLAAHFKKTTATKKNKLAESQNLLLAFVAESEIQLDSKNGMCGHAC